MKGIVLAALAFLLYAIGIQVYNFPLQPIGANLVATSSNIKDASVSLKESAAQLHTDLQQVPVTMRDANAVLRKLPPVIGKLDGALDNINRPCGTKVAGKFLPCGTIQDINETIHSFGNTSTLINIAARHEDKNLFKFDLLADDLHQNLQSSNLLINSASHALNNPDIPEITNHIKGISASGDMFAKDSADKLHSFTHPTKKKGIKAGVDGAMLWIHSRVIPPLF